MCLLQENDKVKEKISKLVYHETPETIKQDALSHGHPSELEKAIVMYRPPFALFYNFISSSPSIHHPI
jgi:hypothetical protein